MSKRTNEQWLAELRVGHPCHNIALADLFQILVNGLRRGLLGQVNTSALEFESLADDFAQDALLKILDKLDTFAGRSQFTTWAHKIAVSVALTELRRKRWKDNSLDSLTASESGDYTPSFIADKSPQPENQTERAELLSHVNDLIQNDLTEKQRTALVASVIEGKSTNEIAQMLDMKPNAVYKLLHDARVRLKKSLERDGMSPAELIAVFER
ncbi:MAG: RNA polymerase sigma factor [Chloroflexi bacterium]|nr:RNA polymerase sigma factor [Chloroflexota bacterium]